jgi:hypothetical protein
MSCCNEEGYYDLELTNKNILPVDRLIRHVSVKPELKAYMTPNRVWNGFNDITPTLVRNFESHARAHVKFIKENMSDYDHLYYLVENNGNWFNAVYFDYENFPLVTRREEVLQEIRKIAGKFFQSNDIAFDATCLYLLYFFALLVNPDSTWITMDHISNGNKYHKFVTVSKRRTQEV